MYFVKVVGGLQRTQGWEWGLYRGPVHPKQKTVLSNGKDIV